MVKKTKQNETSSVTLWKSRLIYIVVSGEIEYLFECFPISTKSHNVETKLGNLGAASNMYGSKNKFGINFPNILSQTLGI